MIAAYSEYKAVEMTGRQWEYTWDTAGASFSVGYVLPVVLRSLDGLRETALVLDAGCGNGAVLGELKLLGWSRLYGLEISQSGVDQACSAHPELSFERADLTSDLSEHHLWGQCDAVISLEVVEHVFLPRLFARNCYGLLKPGGRLIVSTPYHGYLKNVALAAMGQMDTHYTALWDFGHVKFWSYQTISTLLREQGFQDIKFRGAGRLPYLWKSMVVIAQKPAE
jgi:2-polyprenyl-6-hydroxyphenyl methylase/3-demethylubiquinone-9 3-methyltransferase